MLTGDVTLPLVRPLLDDAIRRFPLQPVHLLEMLTALCGAANNVRFLAASHGLTLTGGC